MKKRVSFFFGAGAERDFNMPSGSDYLKKTILLEEKDEKADFLDALSFFFSQEYFKGLNKKSYEYHKHILNNSTLRNHLISNYKYYGIPVELINELKEKNKSLAEIFSDKRFKEYGSFVAGILDSYFHTIVNPIKLGPYRFSKVFNYYWACYFAILEGVLQNVKNSEFNDYFKNNSIQYISILSNIKSFTNKLYKKHKYFRNDDSYYHIITKKINELEIFVCSGVITTNYFNFAEREFKSENVCMIFSYPNGKLSYFEFPEFLEVKDFSETNQNDYSNERLFFPFIFGQSYTKPIVHDLQIKEFKKLKEILDDSDCLVILGYNINEDDMHINSYLHYFINEKPVIVVTDNKSKDIEGAIRSRLRYEKKEDNDNLNLCSVTYKKDGNQEVVDSIFNMIKRII